MMGNYHVRFGSGGGESDLLTDPQPDGKGPGNWYLAGGLPYFEHLQIRNMKRNRQLAKSIHDAGWGTFLRWVKHYGALHDIPVLAVEPHFTSQQCPNCKRIVKKSLSMRMHICPGCGLNLDRDYLAEPGTSAPLGRGVSGQ